MNTTDTHTLALKSGAKVIITPFGADIDGHLSYSEWREVLGSLAKIKHSYLSTLADVTVYGRRRFGDEKVHEAIEQLEFDLSDATKAAAIGALSLDMRRDYRLNSEHAFILSRCGDEQEREGWARKTFELELSPLELKRSIEAGRIVRQKELLEQAGHGAGINTIQGAAFGVRRWEAQMGGREQILLLPATARTKLLDVLRPMIELAAAIEKSLN